MKQSLALVALVAALAAILGFAARPIYGAATRDAGVAAASPTAGDGVDTRSIQVVGQGEVKVKPDIAYINFAVETTNADLAVAQRDNATRMTAVLDRLKSLGIAEQDSQTVGYNVYPHYDKEQGKPSGYAVQNGVRATVRDITKLGGTIDAAVAAGANGVSGISFDLANKTEAMRQAREAAVNDARVKADQYARLVNGTLGAPLKISESVTTPAYDTPTRTAAPTAGSAPETPIQAGEGTLSLTVQIVFELK